MGSITDFLETELLDHVFNNAAYTAPTNLYLALCTADPTDAATGASMNEVANSGSYARTAITFGNAASRRVTQDADVDFPAATGSWGTVTHWAIADSATHGAGNVLAHGALGESKSVVSGNSPTVASGELYVEFSAGEISDFLALELLDHVFNNAAYTPPTSTFVALVTATIDDDDTGSTITEPGSGSYARVEVDPNGGSSPTGDLAASGVVDNTHAITFPTATASWGTIVGVATLDAGTAGNLLLYDNTMGDQAVGTDDTAEFAVGVLDLVMT
jgi:hypothetical protein